MFLRILNDDQKRTLMAIAYQLVVSDHSVSEKEGKLLDELVNGLRTEIPISPQQLLEKPDLRTFGTRDVRCAVILEILSLAYGDNQFPDAESKMVQDLANDLGFTPAEYDKMKIWAVKSGELLNEALAMMQES